MAASPNHFIFTGSRATARIASYLQCRRAQAGIINCKYAGTLCHMTSAGWKERRRSFSPFLRGPLALATGPGKRFENQRVPPRWSPARITAYLQCAVTTSMEGETCNNKKCVKKKFSNSRLIEGATKMVASSNHCIFTMSRVTARIAAYL